MCNESRYIREIHRQKPSKGKLYLVFHLSLSHTEIAWAYPLENKLNLPPLSKFIGEINISTWPVKNARTGQPKLQPDFRHHFLTEWTHSSLMNQEPSLALSEDLSTLSAKSIFFPPGLLKYNWHITWYKFKVYNLLIWYNHIYTIHTHTHIYYIYNNIITVIASANTSNTSITSHNYCLFFVMRNFKIYPLSNFQVIIRKIKLLKKTLSGPSIRNICLISS